jgi:hypothetical protein
MLFLRRIQGIEIHIATAGGKDIGGRRPRKKNILQTQ